MWLLLHAQNDIEAECVDDAVQHTPHVINLDVNIGGGERHNVMTLKYELDSRLCTKHIVYLAAFGKVRPTSFSMSASTSSGSACSQEVMEGIRPPELLHACL